MLLSFNDQSMSNVKENEWPSCKQRAWLQLASAKIWFAKMIKEDFFLSVILKLLDPISRSSLSAEPSPHERIGTGPLHLEQSGTHLHSGDSLPILAAIWGTTFLPKVWFLMSTVFVRKKKNAELPGLHSKCQLQGTEKRGKIVFLLSLLQHQGKKWQWLQIHTVYKKS